MTFYCRFVTTSYIVFFCCTLSLLKMRVHLNSSYMIKSICNRIVCVCHLMIKDYLLTYCAGNGSNRTDLKREIAQHHSTGWSTKSVVVSAVKYLTGARRRVHGRLQTAIKPI